MQQAPSSSSTTQTLLEVNGLTVRFGGIVALNGVNFQVRRGSVTALIGPNGAGKTTVFNCLTGFYRATAGQITLYGRRGPMNVTEALGEHLTLRHLAQPQRLPRVMYHKLFGGSHLVARAGIARTFQNIRLFPEMTVMENLLIANHLRTDRNVLSGVLRLPRYRKAERMAISHSLDWLKVVGLERDANRLARELPYGHQRRLEIARAMCIEPLMICLDEPAAGLNPRETVELAVLIKSLRQDHGVTVFVIEHDMGLVMDVSDHVVVLNYGQVIAADTPENVRNDPLVLSAYLGTDEDEG